MKKYIAYLVLNNVNQPIEFETNENPVEYLWGRYGMDTFIESVEEIVENQVAEEVEDQEELNGEEETVLEGE